MKCSNSYEMLEYVENARISGSLGKPDPSGVFFDVFKMCVPISNNMFLH